MSVKWLTAFCVFLLCFTVSAEAADKKIAVIEFVGQATNDQLLDLTDEARLGVLDATKRQPYTVMTKESMATIARDNGVDLSNCTEGECEVDTGRAIGADFMVTGKLSKSGRRYKLMMKVFDLDSAGLLAGDSVKASNLNQLEEAIREFSGRITAEALGLKKPSGGAAFTAPIVAGAPPQASSTSDFGGGIRMDVKGKLREKRCQEMADSQGQVNRDQRISKAVSALQAKATDALQGMLPQLRDCVQLDYDDRTECRESVERWLTVARAARVDLPEGSEWIETECGKREAVFPAASEAVKINMREAEQWLEKLNDHGSVAMESDAYDQGRRLEYGLGVSQNLRRAAQRYDEACQSGFGKACAALGSMHRGGRGGKELNLRSAVELYKEGCHAGDGESCRVSGEATQSSQGINAAMGWYKKALSINQSGCRRQYADACHSLGRQYSLGQGVSKNNQLAIKNYRAACSAGGGAGCRSLGYAFMHGLGTSRNTTTAKTYYKKACDLGDGAGCRNYGIRLSNTRYSTNWFTKGCSLGDGRSCAIMGYRFEKGINTSKNTRTAASWYRKACDLGDPLGCSNLALASKWGRGVTRSSQAASNYYWKACNLGYAKACNQ